MGKPSSIGSVALACGPRVIAFLNSSASAGDEVPAGLAALSPRLSIPTAAGSTANALDWQDAWCPGTSFPSNSYHQLNQKRTTASEAATH